MRTVARLVETVEQYRVRQERAAEGCVTFRSDRGDDARKLLALVSAVGAFKAARDGMNAPITEIDQGYKRLVHLRECTDAVMAAYTALTTDPEARDGN